MATDPEGKRQEVDSCSVRTVSIEASGLTTKTFGSKY